MKVLTITLLLSLVLILNGSFITSARSDCYYTYIVAWEQLPNTTAGYRNNNNDTKGNTVYISNVFKSCGFNILNGDCRLSDADFNAVTDFVKNQFYLEGNNVKIFIGFTKWGREQCNDSEDEAKEAKRLLVEQINQYVETYKQGSNVSPNNFLYCNFCSINANTVVRSFSY